MRAVIQQVSEARVTIAGAIKGAIQKGLLVLLAVEDADSPEDIEWLSGKIVRLRIFDESGVMNRSVQECSGRDPSRQPIHTFCQHSKRQPPFLQPLRPS